MHVWYIGEAATKDAGPRSEFIHLYTIEVQEQLHKVTADATENNKKNCYVLSKVKQE